MKKKYSENKISSYQTFRWLMAALIDWSIILFALYLAHQSFLFYILAIIVIGNRIHALFILGHDGAHGLICRPRWLNDALTNIFCFTPFALHIKAYRKFHFTHHKFLGTDKDPELEMKSHGYGSFELPKNNKELLIGFFLDLIGYNTTDMLILSKDFGSYNKSVTFNRTVFYTYFALWWVIFVLILYWLGILYLALPVFLISFATSQFAFFRLRIWTEHYLTTGTWKLNECFFMKFLAWPHGAAYHHEHHENPNIPFYDLKNHKIDIREAWKDIRCHQIQILHKKKRDYKQKL